MFNGLHHKLALIIGGLLFVAYSANVSAQTSNVTSASEDSIPVVELNEIIVKASNVVNNPQGYRIRIANEPEAKGKNTVQLLNFLPNISVENETIKINGITASEIRINGRKVQSTTELQNLSAQLIESINVKYVGGANMISETVGGVIDIKLLPTPEKGFYGNVYGSLGFARKMGVSNEDVGGVICAKLGKLNIYEAPSVRWLDLKEWSTQSSKDLETGTDIFRQSLRSDIHTFGYGNSLALSYELNPRHNIGVSWYTGYSGSRITDSGNSEIELLMRSKPRYYSNSVSANYSGKLNDRGDNISFSAEWMNRRWKQTQEFYDSSNKNLSLKEKSNISEFNLDYGHIFNQIHQFNIGAIYKLIKINSDENSTGTSNIVSRSDMDVKAQIPLAYVSLSGSLFQSLRYYAALNWQLNSVKVDAQKALTQNSINPTIQLSYPFGKDKNHNLTVIYKHILDRIPYDAISEKQVWSDPYNYSVGNTSLKAPTEHFVNLIAGLWNNKLNLSASYAYDDNTIFWQTFSDPHNQNVFYTKPVNIGGLSIYALRTELTQRLFDAWTIKAVARVAFNTENMEMSGHYYKGARLRQYYSISNSLNLKGWGAGLNAYVEPTYKYLDRTYHTVYQVECRLYKTFFDDNLQIIADFVPFGNRRKLVRRSNTESITLKYTTPVQRAGVRIVWYLSGGKKDIRVNVKPSSLNYIETKDSL